MPRLQSASFANWKGPSNMAVTSSSSSTELHIYFDTSSFTHLLNSSGVKLRVFPFHLKEKVDAEKIQFKVKKLPARGPLEVNDGEQFLEWANGDFISFEFKIKDIQDLVLRFLIENEESICKEFSFSCLMLEKLFGWLEFPLRDAHDDRDIGIIKVRYLVVKPWKNAFPKQDIPHWNPFTGVEKRSLEMGHRGCGATNGLPRSPGTPEENTVASFETAFKKGADYVELDVQLSKDLTPIVFHDFYANIQAKQLEGSSKKLNVPINALSFDEMMKLEFTLSDGKSDFQYKLQGKEALFPSLKTVLEEAPSDLGIFIEVKYPMQNHDETWEADILPDKVKLTEEVLNVAYSYGRGRRVIFGSFDPDICIMLRLKQHSYPVVFISSCENDTWPPLMDLRCRTFNMALNFAKAEDLLGISICSDSFQETIEDRLQDALQASLELFTWGSLNTDKAYLEKQREIGISGIIYDRVHELKE